MTEAVAVGVSLDPSEPGVVIGALIGAEMDRRSLKQEKIAADAGVSQTFVSDLVAGKTADPRIKSVIRIASAVGLDPGDLVRAALGGTTRPKAAAGTRARSPLETALDQLREELEGTNQRLGLALTRIAALEDAQRQRSTRRQPS